MTNMSMMPPPPPPPLSSPNGFPEWLLDVRLPDYQQERFWLWIKLAGVAFFFLILLPPMFANEVEQGNDETNKEFLATEPTAKPSASTAKRNGKGAKKNTKKSSKATGASTSTDRTCNLEKESREEAEPEFEINQNVVISCCGAFVVAVVIVMIRSSPDNNYTSRAVFQAPLLSMEECQHILGMADAAAQKNYERALEAKGAAEAENAVDVNAKGDDELVNKTVEGLLQEPRGWQKFRHFSYPTTDLNVITDPFTTEDQRYLNQKLDARLGPLLERVFGIPASSIRANDMFIVRYDAGMRTKLTNHTDDGHISFNVLLDDDFEGGGTRFWNRFSKEPFAHVQPTQVGQVLAHSAEVNHEGMHVLRGTRTILVGFLSVDRVDPFTGQWTGLPWLASWGSLPWSMIKFKHGVKAAEVRSDATQKSTWWSHPTAVSLFGTVYRALMTLGDITLPHFVADLVSNRNRRAYLAALDAAYEQQMAHRQGANWFRGQQISVGINGELAGEWNSRTESDYRFSSIEL